MRLPIRQHADSASPAGGRGCWRWALLLGLVAAGIVLVCVFVLWWSLKADWSDWGEPLGDGPDHHPLEAEVLQLIVDMGGGHRYASTALMLTQTEALVCRHGIDRPGRALLRDQDGQWHTVPHVLADDPYLDLAIVRIDSPRDLSARPSFSVVDPPPKLRVSAHGFGQNGQRRAGSGPVRDVWGVGPHGPGFTIGVGARPGCSGSAVVNDRGWIIGFVTMGYPAEDGEWMGAVPGRRLQRFIAGGYSPLELEAWHAQRGTFGSSREDARLFDKASRLAHRSRLPGAIELLEGLVARSKYQSETSRMIWLTLAAHHYRHGAFPDAVDVVERWLEIDPTDCGAWAVLNIYAASADDTENAEAAWQRVEALYEQGLCGCR